MVGAVMLRSLLVLCIALLTCGATAGSRVTVTSAKVDIDHDGTLETVSIEMISGRRYNDDALWCGKGEKYEGSFAVVVDIHGRRVVTLLDPLLGGGPLWFRTQSW